MTTASPTPCPDCGRPIPADAVRGLCPACVARVALRGGAPSEDGLHRPTPHGAYQTHGPWHCLRLLGEGAFGLVYLAEQPAPLPRRAALKVLKHGLASREGLARFAAEREALAVLDHPGIARVLDAGETNGQPWFAAEWVEDARPFTTFCENRDLPRHDRVRLFESVCEAVAHAHQRGIIHRDLKPSNLLVGADGRARVIDFGIARALEPVLTPGTLVTLAGQVLGTPAYMPPEQAAGHGAEADTRSDIYALGAVLYETLTGRPLFPPERLERLPLHVAVRIVCEEAPAKPSTLDPTLRGELEWIVLKALEKDPARRYETAAALARDLRAWREGGTVLAAPPSRAYQARVFLRRHRTAALGVAAVFVVLAAGLAGTTAMFLRAREAGLRAVAGEAAARRAASRGDHQTAQTFFDQGQPVTAVRHLARAVRADPTYHAAAERLLAELVWTDFPRLVRPPVELPEFIRQTGFSPDGTRLAVKGNETVFDPGFVALFDTENGALLGNTTLPAAGVHHFAFSPDSATLALAQTEGTVGFWRAADGTPDPARAPLRLTHPVRHVAWVTADRLATVEDAGEATSVGRLWEIPAGRLLGEIGGLHALAVPAVSPDRSRLAWVAHDGTTHVWDTTTGRALATWTTPDRGAAVFVGDAETLAVQTFGEKLRLFRATDGTRVAVGGYRGAVLLYDLPPFFDHAPPWLAAAAESMGGWRFGDSGLPEPAPPFTAWPADDPWSRWLGAPISTRAIAPRSSQSSEEWTAQLEALSGSR